MLRNQLTLLTLGVILAGGFWWVGAGEQPPVNRTGAIKAKTDGNYKDALTIFRKSVLDPKSDKKQVCEDLHHAVECLQRLGFENEADDLREKGIDVHKDNWRFLYAAAQSYDRASHYGHVVVGKFERGGKRGGGRRVGSYMRDRARAMQLMQQALPLTEREDDKKAVGDFYFHFANYLVATHGRHEPWRLQYLTDLSQLPDYDDQEGYYHGGNWQGAPVDADGKPIYHSVPKSWDDAKSDGERWRWMLKRVVDVQPERKNEIRLLFADFLYSQFGEQTMIHTQWNAVDDTKRNDSGTYALHTLKENETIARLANGVKRFNLPDEFNFLKIYQAIAADGKSTQGERSRDTIAGIFENRRQYPKAAKAWETAIKEYGPGDAQAGMEPQMKERRQKRLDQIVKNWGRFEGVSSFAKGEKATVDFRFRNGKKVSFEAHEILVSKLLDDVKAYLKSNPGKLEWEKTNISNFGALLVEQNQQKYLGKKVESWDLDLKPRPEHVDDRVTVKTPLDKAGAYYVVATMDDGNTSRVVLWLNDTLIVKKNLEGKVLYYVADAANGQPVAKANLEFFGWKQVWRNNGNQYDVFTKNFAENTGPEGQLVVDGARQDRDYQWLITATTKDGRFSHLGFTNVWFNSIYDPEYNATKVFPITDRPVYRPAHTMQFKFWIQHAKYDLDDKSSFANQNFDILITNPKGEKVLEKQYTTDEYGGLAGEFTFPRDCSLGVYGVQVRKGPNHLGGTSVRVEEYKKPEYEVKIEAPKEPVMLGETIAATIQAKYYFGSPVTNAKVKYKVQRSAHSSSWHPTGKWDWYYGRGYWWFSPDYNWYPGFREWGCCRPMPSWWHRGDRTPPELIQETTVPINPDGTVKVSIDTAVAKELHGDSDHKYTITAEVVDESRRTIVGTGTVLVARKPFQVHAWVDRGHYRVGDTIQSSFTAHTLDQKPVQGKGELTLYRIKYDDGKKPKEAVVKTWKLDTNVDGNANQQLAASEPGQYRLSYKVTDSKKHVIEGGYLFVVRGEGFDGRNFQFNDLEMIVDKKEYNPGDKVELMVNTNREGAAILLFEKPTNGVYKEPRVLRPQGKSVTTSINVVKRDMPNFFIETLTIHSGKVFTETREVVVPPEKRILDVAVLPNQTEYLPGSTAKVKVQLKTLDGKPFVGSTVLSVYDRSVEYISGGSNVPEIKEFFWKWRRHHSPSTEWNSRYFGNMLKSREIGMGDLGIFGHSVIEELGDDARIGWAGGGGKGEGRELYRMERNGVAPPSSAPMRDSKIANMAMDADKQNKEAGAPAEPDGGAQPGVRSNFADTAFWNAHVETNKDGIAEVTFKMPENLTGWKVKVWGLGHGTKVGQGETEVVTRKNIIVRLQAPRFFVEKDEVVLSANVHNYLKETKSVTVTLDLGGKTIEPIDSLKRVVSIKSGEDKRVDWRVKVVREGEAIVKMKAVTDVESDAMESRFPVYFHGMLKMDSFSAVIRPDQKDGSVKFTIPAERRMAESRLEVRFSPTLAGALVDALPYMVDYPYGCTEQTLNRFLPTIITSNILGKMNLDLKAIRDKRTNLNAQEIGDASERAKQWKRYDRNPVFDQDEVNRMVKAGVDRLTNMQCGDGGWGWFSGWGEHSSPHTTAVVVHGLQIAKQNDVAIVPNVIERGVAWLKAYQERQVQMIKNAENKIRPWKDKADNLDAMIYMILVDADVKNDDMRDFLYRDRTDLTVYAKAMFGLALHKHQEADKLAMILKNIEQFLQNDDENQTAYLHLPAGNCYWCWYGSEVESNAYYLKLLAKTDPKGVKTSRLVKYLLNNRKHGTYWNNTRDSAVAIEALADYLKASGEDTPDMTIEVWLDGKKHKEVKVDKSNLFSFDNTFLLTGDAVTSGEHKLELKKKGTGPVYFNAYVTNFTLEDYIKKAGLEVKVNRKFYKLTRVDKDIKVPSHHGKALDQKVEKYVRNEISDLATLKSGDLVEVELEIDSKNDYEYLLFEDMKASGFEAVDQRSGYTRNGLGAYMEVRDERVCFFVRALARGKHSVSYRLRAEIPGKFSVLPAKASAMYAPELKGNSDEIKLVIED